MAIDLLSKFSVTSQVEVDNGHDLIAPILAVDEVVELAYKHTRDRVWFTNKRIITLDVQGLTGSKKNYRSFPYGKIGSFAVETAGFFDGDADFKIWVSGVGLFEIKFARKIDVRMINLLLAERTLG